MHSYTKQDKILKNNRLQICVHGVQWILCFGDVGRYISLQNFCGIAQLLATGSFSHSMYTGVHVRIHACMHACHYKKEIVIL